ncbi:MAG: DGQHR domain-containing protein [Dehalococcoidia bacterium]|nr:DGQHR domain-containing protein [Dehalococcoidia bacterium]
MSSLTFSPAIKAKFGDHEYYFTTMKAVDAQREIKLPAELFEVTAAALDQRMQRELRDSVRVTPMVEYLRHSYRFYGPLIVAIKGGDPTFIPLVMSEPNDFVNPDSFPFGVLRFDGTQDYFVLDGQHRLASIAKAIEEGNEEIKHDELGVIIIRHEDSAIGMISSRRLFTHLNRWAKATTMSENITIDEDDGIAIVTRRIVRDHELLKDRIWFRDRQLPANARPDAGIRVSDCFTTLETVYNCNELVLGAKYSFSDDWKRIRPEPDQLDKIFAECKDFWDGLCLIPQIQEVVNGRNPIDFRPNEQEHRGEGHLLFRPVGQEMLAFTIARILSDSTASYSDVAEVCQKCISVDWCLGSPPWRGVFFGEGGRMLGNRTRRSVGSNLLRYMLGIHWPDSTATDLLNNYRNLVYPSDPESVEALSLELPDVV